MKIGIPEMDERRAVDEGLRDGGIGGDEIDFSDLDDVDVEAHPETGGDGEKVVLDGDDLEMLGYGSPMAGVFNTVHDVRDRVFGTDFVHVYVGESLRSPDGGLVVDDVNASELVIDDGNGDHRFRSLGRSPVPSGFHVRRRGFGF